MKEFFRRTQRGFTEGRRAEQSIPDDLWQRCNGCGELLIAKQFADNLQVCPRCGHHERLGAADWIAFLVDDGSWQEHDADLAPTDPLGFVSPKDNYAKKLQGLHEATKMLDAAVAGQGTLDGYPLQLCVSEFVFMSGSMGSVVGEKIARAAERAAEQAMPLLTINTGGGARMHEGMVSLMQMAKVSFALDRLAEQGQPHISLLLDNCYGGQTASYATAADIILAEPRAHIGFAGPRVIAQTIRQKLPAEFQTAELLLEHGMIDMVVPRGELRSNLERILSLYAGRVPDDEEFMALPGRPELLLNGRAAARVAGETL